MIFIWLGSFVLLLKFHGHYLDFFIDFSCRNLLLLLSNVIQPLSFAVVVGVYALHVGSLGVYNYEEVCLFFLLMMRTFKACGC